MVKDVVAESRNWAAAAEEQGNKITHDSPLMFLTS